MLATSKNVLFQININVNVHVYSTDIPVGSADCTIYTPGIGTYSFTVSSPLGRIQHLHTLLQLSQSLQFNFLVPPGTHHCWVDRGGVIWEACPTPLHMAGSVTQAAVTHPSTKWAQRCLTSVIWRELVTIRPCATKLFQGHNHLLTTGTDDPSLAGAWAIIKVSSHQYQWLADGYDLEIGHFLKGLAWWIVAFCIV